MSRKRLIRVIAGVAMLAILIAGLVFVTSRNAEAQRATMAAAQATPTPPPTPTPTPKPTPTPTPESDLPDIDIESWEYILANADNEIGEYAPALATLEGQKLDERIIDAMKEFVADARAAGVSVYLSSGYRGYDEQSYLYNRKVSQYGEEQAKKIVAPPGTSEHQTGLACDITDKYYEFKDSSLENTELYKWMSEHCWEYGFIVRYPSDKEEETGIMYEPWHFRYVGEEAAEYIMKNGLCLEEFIELYK